MDLSKVSYIQITGEKVTFEKTNTGWCATAWEKGLPIARKPMTEQGIINTLKHYKNQEAIILSPA